MSRKVLRLHVRKLIRLHHPFLFSIKIIIIIINICRHVDTHNNLLLEVYEYM